MNSLVEEKAMLGMQKKLTRREAIKWLEERIENKERLSLFLIADKEIVGSVRISKGKDGVGTVGISVEKEFRGIGLGTKLLEKAMNDGAKKFKLRIITLEVLKINKIAIRLYKKLGFEKIGTLKKGAKYYDRYEDSIIMAKYLK
jgi:RimJ/RimL family protein N-acetyltransferase